MQETQVCSLGQEDHLEKKMATTPVFLTRKSHGQRSLGGCSPWGHKRVRYDSATEQQYLNLVIFKSSSISAVIYNKVMAKYYQLAYSNR